MDNEADRRIFISLLLLSICLHLRLYWPPLFYGCTQRENQKKQSPANFYSSWNPRPQRFQEIHPQPLHHRHCESFTSIETRMSLQNYFYEADTWGESARAIPADRQSLLREILTRQSLNADREKNVFSITRYPSATATVLNTPTIARHLAASKHKT